MPVVMVFHKGRASRPEVLEKLKEKLPGILALGLSTEENVVPESHINIIFLEGSSYNVGRDLIIVPIANDFSERKDKIDAIAQMIAREVGNAVGEVESPAPDVHRTFHSQRRTSLDGFVYVFLGAGGVGVI